MKGLLSSKKYLLSRLFTILSLVLMLFTPQITFAADWDATLLGYLYSFIVAIFGSLVYLSGWTLDYAVTHFVVGFGGYYTTSGLGAAIDLLWTKMRDIFNLTFIFGLVYIGFQMIMGSDNGAKKALGLLIMAALLVNFSLFITKSAIDFSNIAAKQFVQGYKDTTAPIDPYGYDISQNLMKNLGITTAFDTKNIKPEQLSLGYIFGTMYLMLIAAFVFAAGAILLIIRFISLNIYMLLSPVMFIGWVFPGFSSISKKYMTGFLGQAFFAPAYFMMIYFSMEVMAAIGTGMKDASSSLGSAFAAGNSAEAFRGFQGPLMFFIVASGFMIASLVVAKKMGAVGADKAVSIGQKGSATIRRGLQRSTGSVVIGGGAKALQKTVGRSANWAANTKWMRNKASTSKFWQNTRGGLDAVGDTSFDARQVAGFGKAAGIGEGKKGGWASRIKENNTTDEKIAKDLGTVDVDKDANGRYVDGDQSEQIARGLVTQRQDQNSTLGQRLAYENQTAAHQTEVEGTKKVKEMEVAAGKKVHADQVEAAQKVHDDTVKAAEADSANVTDPDLKYIEDEKVKKVKEAAAIKLNKVKEASNDGQKKIDDAAALELARINEEIDVAKRARNDAKRKTLEAERDAILSEESKIVYSRQLNFIKRREKEASSQGGRIRGSLNAIGGAGVGLGTVGLGILGMGAILPAMAAAMAINAKGAQTQASMDNLIKQYGTDGRKASQAKEKKENYSILADQIAESNKDITPKSSKAKGGDDETK